MTSKLHVTLALALLGTAIPAAAQTTQPAPQAPAIGPGTVVKHDSGAEVGTVARIEGDIYYVKTDKYEVPIPKTSMTPYQGTLLFGLTREQLNGAVEKEAANRDAAIKPGASVLGAAGAIAGTIEAADVDYVTLKLQSGKGIRIPRSAFGVNDKGLFTTLSAAQLEALTNPAQ